MTAVNGLAASSTYACVALHPLKLRPLTTGLVLACAWLSPRADAWTYEDSAHGSGSAGVERAATAALGLPTGACAHCHSQHGPLLQPMLLFSPANLSQTDNVCLRCHNEGASAQTTALVNRSYSFRAGAWTADPVNDVRETFDSLDAGSSHNLADISAFLTTPTARWGFSAESTPCAACHNPHAATRGTPASRPSHHGTGGSWGLWGEAAAERMPGDWPGYQPPYAFSPVALFEPAGDADPGLAAQNTVNYVALCTDCHDGTNVVFSTTLGRDLRAINWATARHGGGTATSKAGEMRPPYSDALVGTYVLNCTDCHEPHGSHNRYLLREEVNGQAPVAITTLTSTVPGPDARCNKEWVALCGNCHAGLNADGVHSHPRFLPPEVSGCTSGCHNMSSACVYTPCGDCHAHGQRTALGVDVGELF